MVFCKDILPAMVVLLWTSTFLSAATADRCTSTAMNELLEQDALLEGVGNLREAMNLSELLWELSVDLLPQVWNTTFIAGVATGRLNPNFYGDYVLQDAIYCRVVAQLWEQLANNASVHEKIREYANGSINAYQKSSTRLFDRWNVKDDRENNYGIVIRQPVIDYVTFIEQIMVTHAPSMLIAAYACLKLWHNLTSDLLPIVNGSTFNPYAVWVRENHGSGSTMRRQAARIDEWDKNYQWYQWIEAACLFRAAMKNEINFFQNAGNSISSALDNTHKSKHLLILKSLG